MEKNLMEMESDILNISNKDKQPFCDDLSYERDV